MNDQYPASPTPGRPDRQQSAWNGGQGASGGFGKRNPGPFSSAESDSGPFSSGGTTSLFHSGRKQAKSAWGTPVPHVQGSASGQQGYPGQGGRAAGTAPESQSTNAYPTASSYSGQGGYNAPSAPGTFGAHAGAGYRNLGRQPRSAAPRFALAFVVVVISMVISLGAGVVSFFTNDDPTPAPVPIPTFSSPSPLPGTNEDPTPNPSNGQNADGSVTVGVWKVEKLEFLPDATERLAGVADLPELDQGFRFAALKMRFTNEGAVAASPGRDVGVTVYYGDGGGDRSWEEMTIREADSVQSLEEVAPGQSVEGWYYVQVPLDYTGGALAFFDYDGVANVESELTLP